MRCLPSWGTADELEEHHGNGAKAGRIRMDHRRKASDQGKTRQGPQEGNPLGLHKLHALECKPMGSRGRV